MTSVFSPRPGTASIRGAYAAVLPGGADPVALAAWAGELQRAARHDEHPWNAGLLAEALLLAGRKAWQIAASAPRPSPTLAAR